MSHPLAESVLQFGTGRFLRAFADLFVHEVNDAGSAAGRVVALQTTGTQRAELLNRQGGRYHVAIRGLDRGRQVDRVVEVQSVSRALGAAGQWPQVLEVARSPALVAVISNATEAGYALEPDDASDSHPPRSFPAKLLAVLRGRFEAGLPGLTVLPCELLEPNGERLRHLVLDQARRWRLSAGLIEWLGDSCRWRNTLVDRIVSAPRPDDPLAADPLLAVTEPFASWLIEGPVDVPGLREHPAVQAVDRLEPYHLRKVRILNGAHTALVAKARPLGFATVRQAVEDPAIGAWLRSLLFEEIVPTIAGRTDSPEQFAEQTLERLANPLLEHRLADIALYHEVKLKTRLLPTYEEYRQRFGRNAKLLGEILGEV